MRKQNDRLPISFMLCFLIVLMIGSSNPAQTTKPAMPPNAGLRPNLPFADVEKAFAGPDMLYAPFIFWFWDEPLRPEKMAEMARTMAAQGFNPGYAHGRKSMVGTPDLPVSDWLKGPWFAAFDAALKEAETGKAYLGFCDEYWWPSFQAGGRVLEAKPELAAQSLRWDCLDVAAGSRVEIPASAFSVAAELAEPLSPRPKLAPVMGHWIWSPDPAASSRAWLRKTFDIPPGRKVTGARLKITADNAFDLYLNGLKIGAGDDWQKPGLFDLSASIRPGRNVLAVEARNVSDAYGLLAVLAIGLDDGRTLDIRTDRTWLTSASAAAGWEAPAFDDSAWQPARDIAPADGGPWRYVTDRIEHAPATIRSATLRIAGQGAPFTWTAPAGGGPWRVYVFNLYHHAGADGSTVNYLDSRLAPEFIRLALEPYAERYPDRLGRSIPGDFTDNEGDYGWGLAWSPTFAERYRGRTGRDLRLWLPLSLDRDAEGRFAEARWEWFDVISDVYAETFRALTRWCEEHGLSITAHFWEEGLQPQLNEVGDHLKLLRTLTMPGQDCLGRKALKVHDFKEIESVAEFEGRRAATEIMGAAAFDGKPWGTFNPVFLKQAANAVTAWGMSHVIPHGVFATRKLEGNPWPPDWYDENPFFPYLHHWSDFVRRASFINSLGRAVPDVLLLNPIESTWMQASADMFDVEMWSFAEDRPAGKRINDIDKAYAKAIDDLTAARVEFLIGDRHYLGQMSVEAGTLVRGDLRFRAVVLPPLDILTLDTARKIVAFGKAGGRVYALGELPAASAENGLGDPAMKALMEELRAQTGFTACPPAGLRTLLAPSAAGLESPVRFLEGSFPMLQHRRRVDGSEFFWLANNTGEERECRVALDGIRGAAAVWDCETGQSRPVTSSETERGTEVSLVFKPYEAYWLVLDASRPSLAGAPWRRTELTVVATIDGPWTVRYEPKVQPTLEFPVTPPADLLRGAEKKLEDWRAWGLGKFSGLLDYTVTLDLRRPSTGMSLDLGKVAHAAEVWVNGEPFGSRLWGPYVFDIGRALKPGSNEIRVRVANLVGNSYGEEYESGLFGPIRIIRSH